MSWLFRLVVLVAFALSTQQMALARGASGFAAGHVVLCTGQGVQLVAVGHDGEPVDVVHSCPDCVLAHVALPEADVPPIGIFVHIGTVVQDPVISDVIVVMHSDVQARGPPDPV